MKGNRKRKGSCFLFGSCSKRGEEKKWEVEEIMESQSYSVRLISKEGD